MHEHRFNVFGTFVAVVASGDGWLAFYLGTEGKRRLADFIVPADVTKEELAQYLGDLFHEDATPRNNEVKELT